MNPKWGKLKHHNPTVENYKVKMLKACRRKTMDYLEGNNDSNDCKFLIRNHGGQNKVESLVTRMYKDLLERNNKEIIK